MARGQYTSENVRSFIRTGKLDNDRCPTMKVRGPMLLVDCPWYVMAPIVTVLTMRFPKGNDFQDIRVVGVASANLERSWDDRRNIAEQAIMEMGFERVPEITVRAPIVRNGEIIDRWVYRIYTPTAACASVEQEEHHG